MNAYVLPIKYALFTFPILAALLTIPFLIVQYRKYGYVNKFRSVILYSFLLYCITAYYLVVLPLPKQLNNCVRDGSLLSYMQLTPFDFVRDISERVQFRWNSPMSYLALIKEPAFYQVLFNICLTMPLGIYLRYYFRKGFKQTLFFSMLTACFFEFTQLSGLYGIYACPYRVFDVDDLMVNTFGGLLGFWIAPLLTYFLPRTEELDNKVELAQMKVGFIRRGISLAIDLVCMGALVPLTASIQFGMNQLGLNEAGLEWITVVQRLVASSLIILLYMMVMPAITGGKTVGKMVTRIHVIEDSRRGQEREVTFLGLFKRYSLLYYGTFGFFLFIWLIIGYGVVPSWGELFALLLGCAVAVWLGIHLLLRIFSRDKLLFYERISGTRNVITVHPNTIDESTPEIPTASPNESVNVEAVENKSSSPQDSLHPNKQSEFMSASNIPMPDAIELELERLKNKLKRQDP